MKKSSNPKSRGPQMRQRVTQKHSMRNVVIASSILGCMVIALLVVNLSSNESSYADNKVTVTKTTYRSVDINLQERMLLGSNNANRVINTDYKGKDEPQTISIASRALNVIVKKTNEVVAE